MTLFLVIIITIIGIILRLVNISSFKFYPDSYQNLLVALNIQNYGSVVGFLGEKGMFYPDFFMWTRPVYPILINIASALTNLPIDQSALYICTLTSILSIPLAYFFISRLFNSKSTGLLASFLLAISFNHIVWSGYIYTEAPAIFINLLFFTSLTINLTKKSLLADKYDLLSGILFAFAIFSRYEYIVLAIPVLYFIINQSPNPKQKLLNIFLGTSFTSTIILTQLYPVTDLLPVILTQLQTLLRLALTMVIALLTVFAILHYSKPVKQKVTTHLPRFLIAILIAITIITILQMILGDIIPFYEQFRAMKKFFLYDFLLAIFTISGLLLMLTLKTEKSLAYFALLSIAVLWPVYNRINPDMQRYWTHLLPFLIIPAAFSANLLLEKFKHSKLLLTVAVLMVAAQLWISGNGMKTWNEGIWFKESYEEKSAKILTEKLKKENKEELILLTSMPESYYLYSGFSTHSIADKPPYLFIPDELNNKKIRIIQDIGMRDLFPNFNQIIEQKLQDKKIDQYHTGANYKFAIKTLPETVPVIIYETTLQDLKERIKQ